ncbi:biotin/lipoyl-containing protein [Bacillus sp. B15-48]|uniref:biotin/lipoyl-containing protein n=1 Tax=Bacillus sp. B15-48 TaxID=1548601 RepID=UPI00193F28C4|nr:biotin/lipoyl-containing protein [Bacillus sp. B15-48]MBM4763846.1 biotin attachment protein [Bacillus sp. B15-48]
MIVKIKMPQHGSQMIDGDIVKWIVAEGSHVEKGEDMVEVEAAKASFTIQAPESGTIKTINAAEDENVAVGAVIATLETNE